MARIRIVSGEEASWAAIADPTRTDTEGNTNLSSRAYFVADSDGITLVEVHKGPPVVPAAPHAHGVDEIMYVLEGELIIGNRRYGPGSAVFVPANTLYSFSYGESGVRYLNMRPHGDATTITKDEFLERRSRTKDDT